MSSSKKASIITPFNKPFIVGKELYNIARAVVEHSQLSGDGYFTKKCQEWLQDTLQCKAALLTNSCTAALEMSAILCGLEPGDEIILPSFTFVSTANAFVLRGAIPVFVDIRKDTLNLDERKIEQAITEKTKAIVPVHYAGIPCEMGLILDLAERYNLFIIEDAAQALLSDYKGKKIGTLGHFGTLSFHETKNIISGEGGALLINDERYIERAEIVWEKGTNRKQFFRGEVDKYSWVDLGSSFLPSEITAAFLSAQFDQAKEIISDRKLSFDYYYDLLKPLEIKGFISLPCVEEPGNHNGHIFYIVTNTRKTRDNLLQVLKENGIYAIFHYVPLHTSKAGKKYGRTSGNLFNTERASDCVIRLPLYYNIGQSTIEKIVEIIFTFYKE